ncbi:hypothetical protein D9M69_425720 [compost metagenome]
MAGEVGDECLIHHVVHHFTRGVEGTGLLACGAAGVRVVAGQQVLEHLAQQFGVQRHFFIQRRVLVHRESVAVQQVDQSFDGIALALGFKLGVQ